MNRRGFISGLASLLAAPAIVPFASLMPVRGIIQNLDWEIEVLRGVFPFDHHTGRMLLRHDATGLLVERRLPDGVSWKLAPGEGIRFVEQQLVPLT